MGNAQQFLAAATTSAGHRADSGSAIPWTWPQPQKRASKQVAKTPCIALLCFLFLARFRVFRHSTTRGHLCSASRFGGPRRHYGLIRAEGQQAHSGHSGWKLACPARSPTVLISRQPVSKWLPSDRAKRFIINLLL